MPSKRQPIPFTGHSHKGKNIFINSEECINYYPEVMPDGKLVLRGSPGLTEFADTGLEAGIRGWIVSAGLLYVVAGSTLFSVTKLGVVTTIGDVSITTPMVFMIENSLQVGIFGGPKGYVYTIATDTLAQITDTDFPGASSATYQDGFAIVSRPGTAQFFKSGLNDFTSWGALDFSAAGWKSDNLVRVFSDHRDLWLMGDDSIEVWYNSGAADFPFANRPGAEMEMGIVAADSVAAGDNGTFWLGKSEHGHGLPMQALGLQPKMIGTTAIHEAIQSYSDISDAIGFTCQHDGHVFYELVFPTGNAAWVFDSTTGFWHERQSILERGRLGRHRIQHHAFFAGKNLVGDYTNGKIYELTRDVYDEDGTEMPAIRTSQTLVNNQDLLTFDELQILFTPGVGLSSATDYLADPKAIISWSDDGGYTWSNEIEVPLGKVGKYKNRAVLYMLGQGRNRVFRSKVTAPVNRDIFGAFAMVEIDNQ